MVDFAAMKASASELDGGPGRWTVYDEEDQTLLLWVAPVDDPIVEAMAGNEVWVAHGGNEILAAGGFDVRTEYFRSGVLTFRDGDREMVEEWLAIPKEEVGE